MVDASAEIELLNSALKAKGLDFIMGMDLPRVFASGVQTFANPDMTMIVFREQNGVAEEGAAPELLLKNVASIIIPTSVALQFRDQLNAVLAPYQGESGGSAPVT